MYLIKLFTICNALILFNACNINSQSEKAENSDTITLENSEANEFGCEKVTRDDIISRIKHKKANNLPLVVHVFVPLCDNEHQGIVSTSKSLGNGMNLKTNLYWGAGYGIKTHFVRKKDWKLLSSEKNIDTNVLERVIFMRQYNSKTKVVLIADAYRGDRMEVCLRDYFNSLAGLEQDTILIENDSVNYVKQRDFIVFNGHNGLMDVDVEWVDNEDNILKDAAVIACSSAYYFMDRLKCLKAYPLVTTQSLLPPEAYILEGIIDAWALEKSNEEIRLSAGNGMFKVFKRNQKAIQNIFVTGWWEE